MRHVTTIKNAYYIRQVHLMHLISDWEEAFRQTYTLELKPTNFYSNLCNMISVFGILVVCSLLTGHVLSAARDPIIKQFEVDEHNNVIRPYEIRDEYRSQIIVEKLGNLRLECHADYPVQWIYTGNGVCRIIIGKIIFFIDQLPWETVPLFLDHKRFPLWKRIFHLLPRHPRPIDEKTIPTIST